MIDKIQKAFLEFNPKNISGRDKIFEAGYKAGQANMQYIEADYESLKEIHSEALQLLEKAKCCGSCWFWYSLDGHYDCRWDPDESPGVEAYEGPCEGWVARE